MCNHGESVIIEDSETEYKKYYLNHSIVDWEEFKAMRPEDRLNLDELDKMKKIMDVRVGKNHGEEHGPSENLKTNGSFTIKIRDSHRTK